MAKPRAREDRAATLEQLLAAKEIVPAIPVLYVPELFSRSHGLRATRQVAEALSAELF